MRGRGHIHAYIPSLSYIHKCIHTYITTYTHTLINTFIFHNKQTHLHTSQHTYVDIHTHTERERERVKHTCTTPATDQSNAFPRDSIYQ
mgnify:CR=1 FL=1